MAKRASLSKRLRMEVLKRDGFRCVYCGATPVNALLQIDHVQPVAGGGGNDPANLVTSCGDCNQGKSDIPLTERRLPALDPEAAREHADQLAGYLEAIKDIQARREEIRDLPRSMWERLFRNTNNPTIPPRIDSATVDIISELGIEAIEEAFTIISQHAEMGVSNWQSSSRAEQQTRYFFGIIKRRRSAARPAHAQTVPAPDFASARGVIRAVIKATSICWDVSQPHLDFLWFLVSEQDSDGWVYPALDPELEACDPHPYLQCLEELERVGLIRWYECDGRPVSVELPVEFRLNPSSDGWSIGSDGFPAGTVATLGEEH